MRDIVLIIHNVRSAHNVGSLLRTADGIGINKVFITGYTPYPSVTNDTRLPHISRKLNQQIEKTALGAQNSVDWEYVDGIFSLLKKLREKGYHLTALEQYENSVRLVDYLPSSHVVIVVGSEVEGVGLDILHAVDDILEIPMLGQKESFNVAVAAAMALYHCRFLAP